MTQRACPNLARIAGATGAVVEIVCIVNVDPGDLSVVAEQRIVLVVAAPDQERRLLRGRAGDKGVAVLADIRIGCVSVSTGEFASIEIPLENDVDDAGHGIGSIDGGGPILEHFY